MMSLELTVPEVGESITEVLIGRWLKADGEAVSKDEDLVEIETDKASVVVAAPEAGVVAILKAEGESAAIGEAIARISADEANESAPRQVAMEVDIQTSSGTTDKAPASPQAPAAPQAPSAPTTPEPPEATDVAIMPAAARLIAEHQLDPGSVAGSGAGGRLLKKDVLRHIEERNARDAARAALDTADEVTHAVTDPSTDPSSSPSGAPLFDRHIGERVDEARPMSRIRQTIATRLVEAQQNAALLTTFNEVDMKPIIDLRARHKAAFETRHGIKLGFMPFFVHAAIEALRRFPAVNAEVRGDEIVYRNYHDIGIAIGGGRGLLVPVLRDADRMSFADIEHRIADLVARAQDNRVTPDELEGGTFTISNGGIYGSLLSTPIVNPPQSGILGMHTIQERPVVRDGEIVARPMMYLALTYDHRLIDGREAVTFLRTIADVLEEPARLVIGV